MCVSYTVSKGRLLTEMSRAAALRAPLSLCAAPPRPLPACESFGARCSHPACFEAGCKLIAVTAVSFFMVGWCAWWGYKKNWLGYSLSHGGRFTSGETCLQCPEQLKVPPVVPITLCSSMYSEQAVFSDNFLSRSTKARSPVWINGLGNRLFPPTLSSLPSTLPSLSPPFLDLSWETCTFWRHLSWPHCLKRGCLGPSVALSLGLYHWC